MKSAVGVSASFVLAALVGVCLLIGTSGSAVWMPSPASAAEGAPPLPPLKIDLSAPLLLEQPGPETSPKAGAKSADNSACYVCHENYEEEFLVVEHAQEEIGCVACHGPSHAHTNDEDNVTPPDIMYAPEAIDSACGECHDEHDVSARKVIRRWIERCPEKGPDPPVCTDCHGQHRLPRRTSVWDKRTGELIVGESK